MSLNPADNGAKPSHWFRDVGEKIVSLQSSQTIWVTSHYYERIFQTCVSSQCRFQLSMKLTCLDVPITKGFNDPDISDNSFTSLCAETTQFMAVGCWSQSTNTIGQTESIVKPLAAIGWWISPTDSCIAIIVPDCAILSSTAFTSAHMSRGNGAIDLKQAK